MRLALMGAALFLLALARSMADGVGMGDESWFLQVIARMRAGDVLYREVFLGVTPLSAYLTAAMTFVTGVDVIAVKIVTNGCFALTAMLAFRLAERAGLSSLAALAIAGAMFVWGRPYNNAPYTAMAVTFLMAALIASLRGAWVTAGILAGLSFGAKQNVGVLVIAAVWGVALLRDDLLRDARPEGRAYTIRRHAIRRDFVGPTFRSGVSFLATSALVLVPVVATGAASAFWDYGFAAKGAYLNVGAVPYTDSVRVVVSSMMSLPASAPTLLHDINVLLPIAVLMSASVTFSRFDRIDGILLMFAAAATLVAFPRWDRFHMGYAVPVHLIALGRMSRHWPALLTGPSVRTAAAWSLASLTTMVAVQPAAIVARGARLSPLPHFRGAFMSPAHVASLSATAARLREAAAGQPVFVLTPHSGFWYLVSGVKNPTPLDTPARTATGRNGIPWLIDQFDSLAIDRVCVLNGPPDAQTLTDVITYVRANFVEGTNVGPCTMFHATAFALDLRRVSASGL